MIFGNTQQALDYGLEYKMNSGKIMVLKKDGDIYFQKFGISHSWVRVIKVLTYGETAGYRRTELTYAGDLVIEAG
jgi:hypothetical protein